MKRLEKGDCIGVVAPSRRPEPDLVERFTHFAQEHGFRVKWFGFEHSVHRLMLGSDAERAQAIAEAFRDEDVALVLAARGGYGCTRILDRLDAATFQKKPIVGFSDITALILDFHARAGLTSFHGPTASELVRFNDPQTHAWFFDVLMGRQTRYDLTPQHFSCWQPGVASGALWGGNVTLLQATAGTPSSAMPDGAILLFEDVSERMYVLDRALTHFRQMGWFERASGIIFGDLQITDGHTRDNTLGVWWEEVLEDHFADFKGPIAYGLPCSHVSPHMTLPIGAQCDLEVSQQSLSLSFDTLWDTPAT